MSRWVELVEECEHGDMREHTIKGMDHLPRLPLSWCLGGSRTVLEGIPDEWVKRAVDLVEHDLDQPNFEMGVAMEPEAFVRAVLEAAVFGETP